MQIEELDVGTVYRCVGGWYRRLTRIEGDTAFYDLGWMPDAKKGSSVGPLDWFARKAIEPAQLSSQER